MKIIISHDVDHLYPIDHLLHDLIIPKLWIRSLIHLLQGRVSLSTFINRLGYIFYKRYHRIEEVILKDKEYNIPSTFFFGMERGLGMSYGEKKARRYIEYVTLKGFDAGVHGISYQDINKMKNEFTKFKQITSKSIFGIRMHYVRQDEHTIRTLAQCGYLFDTTEFDKAGKTFKHPYKVENMWEFPLHIMDGYIMPPGDLKQGKANTINDLKKAESENVEYCTILFHDYQYNSRTYPQEKLWYDWLLEYLISNHYEIVSYREAIEELEKEQHNGKLHNTIC